MREPGFYWVKGPRGWFVAEFIGHGWLVPGDNTVVEYNAFHEIDETRITRGKPIIQLPPVLQGFTTRAISTYNREAIHQAIRDAGCDYVEVEV